MFVWANDLALVLVAHPGFDTPREKHVVGRCWFLSRGQAPRRLTKKNRDITMLAAEVQNAVRRLAVGCGVCRKIEGSHTRE